MFFSLFFFEFMHVMQKQPCVANFGICQPNLCILELIWAFWTHFWSGWAAFGANLCLLNKSFVFGSKLAFAATLESQVVPFEPIWACGSKLCFSWSAAIVILEPISMFKACVKQVEACWCQSCHLKPIWP